MTITKCKIHKVKMETSEIDGEKYCPVCENDFWDEDYDVHKEINDG